MRSSLGSRLLCARSVWREGRECAMGRSPWAASPELVSVGTLPNRGVQCSGKMLLTEGQTLSAQRNAACSLLGKNGAFLLHAGDTPGWGVLSSSPVQFLVLPIWDETIRVGLGMSAKATLTQPRGAGGSGMCFHRGFCGFEVWLLRSCCSHPQPAPPVSPRVLGLTKCDHFAPVWKIVKGAREPSLWHVI